MCRVASSLDKKIAMCIPRNQKLEITAVSGLQGQLGAGSTAKGSSIGTSPTLVRVYDAIFS